MSVAPAPISSTDIGVVRKLEEALFGNGVTLKVTMTWDGSVARLYLNGTLAQQSSYATPTPCPRRKTSGAP